MSSVSLLEAEEVESLERQVSLADFAQLAGTRGVVEPPPPRPDPQPEPPPEPIPDPLPHPEPPGSR